jgi:hypothetical protein
MTPPPYIKAQLLETLARTSSPTRAQRQWQSRWLWMSALVFMLVVFLSFGGVHAAPRPTPFILGTAFGWLALAALCVARVLPVGSSMLGPRPLRLILTIVLVPAVAFLWMLLWNLLYPETLVPWIGRPGFRCLGLTLFMAGWPLLAMALSRRQTATAHAGMIGAALGVGVGACAGLLVQLYCPIANPAHAALGHLLPFLILAAVGAVLGRLLIIVSR